jgi:hypothetical protein
MLFVHSCYINNIMMAPQNIWVATTFSLLRVEDFIYATGLHTVLYEKCVTFIKTIFM